MSRTLYLTIPKEKAERLIVSSDPNLTVRSKTDEKIKIGYKESSNMHNKWISSLYDY